MTACHYVAVTPCRDSDIHSLLPTLASGAIIAVIALSHGGAG
jgi:hypothetical protein